LREAPGKSSEQANRLLGVEEVLSFCLLTWDLVPLLVLQIYHYHLDKSEDFIVFLSVFWHRKIIQRMLRCSVP